MAYIKNNKIYIGVKEQQRNKKKIEELKEKIKCNKERLTRDTSLNKEEKKELEKRNSEIMMEITKLQFCYGLEMNEVKDVEFVEIYQD